MQDTVNNRLRDRHTSLGRYPLPLSQEGRKQVSSHPSKRGASESGVTFEFCQQSSKFIPTEVNSCVYCQLNPLLPVVSHRRGRQVDKPLEVDYFTDMAFQWFGRSSGREVTDTHIYTHGDPYYMCTE